MPQASPTRRPLKTIEQIPKTKATTELGAVLFVILFSSIIIYFLKLYPLQRYTILVYSQSFSNIFHAFLKLYFVATGRF